MHSLCLVSYCTYPVVERSRSVVLHNEHKGSRATFPSAQALGGGGHRRSISTARDIVQLAFQHSSLSPLLSLRRATFWQEHLREDRPEYGEVLKMAGTSWTAYEKYPRRIRLLTSLFSGSSDRHTGRFPPRAQQAFLHYRTDIRQPFLPQAASAAAPVVVVLLTPLCAAHSLARGILLALIALTHLLLVEGVALLFVSPQDPS